MTLLQMMLLANIKRCNFFKYVIRNLNFHISLLFDTDHYLIQNNDATNTCEGVICLRLAYV